MRTHLIVPRRPVFPVPALFNSVGFEAFDQLFDEARSLVGVPMNAAFSPSVNVDETDREFRLTAELPGLEEKDFEVIVDGDLVILKGEKKSEPKTDDEGYTRSERSAGKFERRFRLGWEVDADTVSASYKHGVLDVVIPKPAAEQNQPRTIPITSG